MINRSTNMRIVCLMGKSGCGKSSIENRLEKLGYNRIVSYTTRNIREGEQNDREYHFVSKDQFKHLIEKDILMEYAEYAGNYYGAPRPIGSINNVIVVESDGFRSIKQIYGKQAIGVYIDVSNEIAEKRRNKRSKLDKTDTDKRKSDDEKKFSKIKDEADIVIDGSKSLDDILIELLQKIKEKQ